MTCLRYHHAKKTFKLHSARANCVAKIWRLSLQSNIDAPNFSGYGWDSEGTIECVQNPFPNNMDDILFDPLFDEDDYESASACKESDDDYTRECLK